MSGKFVSGGMLDKPNERDQEWLQAEQELEQRRRDRLHEEEGSRHDGKTLFEALQANRDKKEAEFQESIKLKHQFRALDDDEVDFLNAQAQKSRAKEQTVQQETSEQLELFRQKQGAANQVTPDVVDEAADPDGTDWSTTKKRKRVKEKEAFKGVKVRRKSMDIIPDVQSEPIAQAEPKALPVEEKKTTPIFDPPSKKPALGLVSYDSEDEDD